MTDSPWMDEWMRAWRAFPETVDGNPWTAMLEHFAKSHPAACNQWFADPLRKITEQSRAFFDLGQTLASNEGRGWQDSVFRYLDDVAERLRDPESAARTIGGMPPLDYWGRLAGHGKQPPPDQASLMSQLEALLRMPGLGYTRERQEFFQELSRLWLRYERAYGEYAAYCAETARRSVERLRERLTGEFANGGGPTSIRALYDTWAACSEEVYAERVATDDYMRLHGRMVNALMAYRGHASRLLDEWAKAADMPTREEVDALHRKLEDMRRELRELKTAPGTSAPGKKKRKKKSKKKRAAKK